MNGRKVTEQSPQIATDFIAVNANNIAVNNTTLRTECKACGATRLVPGHVASNSQIGCAHQQLHKLADMESVHRTEQDILMPTWSPDVSRIAQEIDL